MKASRKARRRTSAELLEEKTYFWTSGHIFLDSLLIDRSTLNCEHVKMTPGYRDEVE